MWAYQQKWRLGHQRRKYRRFDGIQADDSESRQPTGVSQWGYGLFTLHVVLLASV
jgi:hypothetical protein